MPEEGRITDGYIERARAQIGILVFQRDEAWNKLQPFPMSCNGCTGTPDTLTHSVFRRRTTTDRCARRG